MRFLPFIYNTNRARILTCIYRDWKKLTFYYFADSYINFNSLVTDLFKIYKTRIWMSAINPASFVTPPSAGLQSPNPLGYGQDVQTDRPHQQESRAFGSNQNGVNDSRDAIPNPLGVLRNAYPEAYQPFTQGPRAPESLARLGAVDPFSTYTPNAYTGVEPGYTDYATGSGASAGPGRAHAAPGEWMGRFQGLSLGGT